MGSGTIFLDVLLVNDSDSALFFTEQSPDWDYRLDIVGPDGSPLKLTNYGVCVLPQPSTIFRNILRKLDVGLKDHIEPIELKRLYRLDRVGQYRVVVRRRVWRINPAYSSLPLLDFIDQCRPLTQCADQAEVSSSPFSFELSSPYPDVSPQSDPARCR